MEIKRTTEIFVETRRWFIVRQAAAAEQAICPRCGEPLLRAEHAAVLLEINCRAVFQISERGAAHFVQTATGATLVCPSSLAATYEDDQRKQLSAESPDRTIDRAGKNES